MSPQTRINANDNILQSISTNINKVNTHPSCIHHGFITTQRPCPSVLMCGRPKNKMRPRNVTVCLIKYCLLTQCSAHSSFKDFKWFQWISWMSCGAFLVPKYVQTQISQRPCCIFLPRSAHRKLPGLKAGRMPAGFVSLNEWLCLEIIRLSYNDVLMIILCMYIYIYISKMLICILTCHEMWHRFLMFCMLYTVYP